jgi:HEPN domain-containing protein
MSPAEDAALLLAIVRRHLITLRLALDPAYPEEDWGFTAQQAVEKILKAWIVLGDRQPPRRHDLNELARLAGVTLDPLLLELQTFAVEARYEEGPFPLPAAREELVARIEQLLEECGRAIEAGCAERNTGSAD